MGAQSSRGRHTDALARCAAIGPLTMEGFDAAFDAPTPSPEADVAAAQADTAEAADAPAAEAAPPADAFSGEDAFGAPAAEDAFAPTPAADDDAPAPAPTEDAPVAPEASFEGE